MRLLIITIIMMGSVVLMMEFALVDTARIHQQANEPVEVTFRDGSGNAWNAEVTPSVLPRTAAARERDETRARILWEASRKVTDLEGRRRILQDLVAMQSSYRPRALKALEVTTRALANGAKTSGSAKGN